MRTDEAPGESEGGAAGADPVSLPEFIGHYRILGKLGQGGMGVVLEAEQESPRRRVALKVGRAGAELDDVQVRMFEREAETLARLEHPNIAAIHEAGRTDDGRQFFAMELVRGATLDRWLATRPREVDRDELERRLRMFRTVCDAVQFAHQRGVIHRDLKPSNLVVVDEDEAPRQDVVKVLDFGLARVTDPEEPMTSLATEVGVIKGTLGYMSPEQARGDPAEIDTRTDVYSLGILLYELLTGVRPIDLDGASVLDALHRICEEAARPLEAAWPGPGRVDPDLATIVGKALEKEPAERYSSAAALSEDVGRYLANEPILARPPSTVYQLKKLIARRKAPFAAAAAFLVLLVAFAVSMSVLYARSERNLARALEAETTAEENFRFARDAVDRYFVQVSESEDLAAHGLEPLRRELLDTAREFYADLVERSRGAEGSRADLGAAHLRLAGIARIVGDHEAAAIAADEGLRVFEELAAEEPGNRYYRRELAALRGNLGLVLADVGRDEEAEAAYRDALATDEALAAEPDASHADRSRLGNSLDNLAQLLEGTGRTDDAERLYARAVEIREALHDDAPDDALYLRELVQTLNNHGILYARQARLEEAEPPLTRAIEFAAELSRIDPGSASDNVAAVTWGNLAGVRMLAGRLDEALSDYERELVLRRDLVRRHPAVLDHHLFLGTVLCNLGELEVRAQRPENAMSWFEDAVDTFEHLLATTPDHAVARQSRSYTHGWTARAFEALDLWEEAAAEWENAIEFADRGDPGLAERLRAARERS